MRENYFLIDLYFSKSKDQTVNLTVTPIKNVILKNRATQANELIFRNESAKIGMIANKAPDISILTSLANSVESSTRFSSSTSLISSGLSVIALISNSGLGAPLMKFFKIFKLVSRLRLINVDFGAILELVLTLCNSVFMIGGDEIGKEAMISNPNTRGKLNKYKVTVLTVEAISLKYAVYWMILIARFFRVKVRRYAPDEKDLSFFDKLTNQVAESGRVLLLTFIGIDVYFYSMHCVCHLDRLNGMTLSGFMSFWLSFVTLIALNFDFSMMVFDNRTTTFIFIREKFRRKANLKVLLQKLQAESQNSEKRNLNMDLKVPDNSLNLPKVYHQTEKEPHESPKLNNNWREESTIQSQSKQPRSRSSTSEAQLEPAIKTLLIFPSSRQTEKSNLSSSRKIIPDPQREEETQGRC